MIKKIALALVAVVAVVAIILGYATTLPDTFAVQRSIAIKAPPEKIMALVADFHHWRSWSPWEELDPAMQRTFAGAPSGKGAIYSWKGNSDVGEGRMEILDLNRPTRVTIKLDFIEPIASSNVTSFTLTPEGEYTRVVWDTSGPMHYITKVMNVFISMDKMIGPDFERGLAKMKSVAEK